MTLLARLLQAIFLASSFFSLALTSSNPTTLSLLSKVLTSPSPSSSADAVVPFSFSPRTQINVGRHIFENGTYETYAEKMFSLSADELDRCYYHSRMKCPTTKKDLIYPFLCILVYYCKDDRVLEHFASSGMNIETPCDFLTSIQTPLSIAIAQRKTSFVRILLENGANLLNPSVDPALIIAVKDGNIELVKMLIEEFDCSPNVRSLNGTSAIGIAVSECWIEITQYLASLENMSQIEEPIRVTEDSESSSEITSSITERKAINRDLLVSPIALASNRGRGRTITSPDLNAHMREYVKALTKSPPPAPSSSSSFKRVISDDYVYEFDGESDLAEEEEEEEESYSLEKDGEEYVVQGHHQKLLDLEKNPIKSSSTPPTVAIEISPLVAANQEVLKDLIMPHNTSTSSSPLPQEKQQQHLHVSDTSVDDLSDRVRAFSIIPCDNGGDGVFVDSNIKDEQNSFIPPPPAYPPQRRGVLKFSRGGIRIEDATKYRIDSKHDSDSDDSF